MLQHLQDNLDPRVVDYIRAEYKESLLGYMARMRSPHVRGRGRWGGPPEVVMVATLARRAVWVWRETGQRGRDAAFTRIGVFEPLIADMKINENPHHIFYSPGHYDLLDIQPEALRHATVVEDSLNSRRDD